MATKVITWFNKSKRLMICRCCGHIFKAPNKRKFKTNKPLGYEYKYPNGTWTHCPNGCNMIAYWTSRGIVRKPWSVLKVCTTCPLYKTTLDCQKA